MKSGANVVVNIELDEETITEIDMLRKIRLKHYEEMALNPSHALQTLIKAGLTEQSSPAQIASTAQNKILELKARLSERDVIYEDELALYVNSLNI